VTELLTQLGSIVQAAAALATTAPPALPPGESLSEIPPGAPLMVFVPLLALASCALCGVCAAMGVKSKLPAWITVACLTGAFLLTAKTYLDIGTMPHIAHAWDWITFQYGSTVGETFTANFSFYIDSLTLLWMLFVTGLAAVIALYASEYMSHDVGLGYCRFYAAFNLFVFSMACLVMGDNLVLLFLGWEGVGLCSYLLIGYFYKRPAAVAAAKKAFIVNRIGDLGLVMGLLLTFVVFGSIEYKEIFRLIAENKTGNGLELSEHWSVWAIPMLLTVGAFGKSAQLFFYVWLPDAMEGPTPVSALIHAATMVTAGVFLIARMYPLFVADPYLIALTFVAWAGAITAFWAATIEMAIFDIKRVMGYSTISQLGFMFAGLGVLTPTGAAFHTFTHAFFKATLFLGVGAVMHGFGGQLDLRRLSGVMWMRGFGLVGIAMLVGSINLAGVPFTAGYFSKDMILAQAFSTPSAQIGGVTFVAWLLLLTAGMTAYYTFRTFFRVYVGPKEFSPGEDAELIDMGRHPKGTSLDEWHSQHGHGHATQGADHKHAARVDFDPTTEEFDPHPPGFAMKAAIATTMVLTIVVAALYFIKSAPGGQHGGWVGSMIHNSTANYHSPHGGTFLGMDPHKAMYYVSAAVGAIGVLIAAYLHGPRGIWGLFVGNREKARTSRADAFIPLFGPLTNIARKKWYVDEVYDWVFVKPLWVLSHVLHAIDKVLVDGLVNLFGWTPRGVGGAARGAQTGVLHDYAVRMAGGVALIIALVLIMREVRP